MVGCGMRAGWVGIDMGVWCEAEGEKGYNCYATGVAEALSCNCYAVAAASVR